MQIIPTILEKDFVVVQNKIKHVNNLVNWLQIDVIDGQFTFGKIFELELINSLEGVENILWETHLMVKEPIKWIEKSIFINTSRIIGQVEMMSNRKDFIEKIKNDGLEAGLAFDIETEINDIPEETDLILLMSRRVGFGSYPFEEKIYERIKTLVKIKEKLGLSFLIGIDGGVNTDNIKKLEEAGADIAYCGTAVFDGKVEDNLENLKYASKD
jgi:ribulose-phosphate 3-epimerase